jgi:hypothetical protein
MRSAILKKTIIIEQKEIKYNVNSRLLDKSSKRMSKGKKVY